MLSRLHVDGRKENKNLIGEKELDLMKEGSVFINLSRGHVVDLKRFGSILESGKIRGAGSRCFSAGTKDQ